MRLQVKIKVALVCNNSINYSSSVRIFNSSIAHLEKSSSVAFVEHQVRNFGVGRNFIAISQSIVFLLFNSKEHAFTNSVTVHDDGAIFAEINLQRSQQVMESLFLQNITPSFLS